MLSAASFSILTYDLQLAGRGPLKPVKNCSMLKGGNQNVTFLFNFEKCPRPSSGEYDQSTFRLGTREGCCFVCIVRDSFVVDVSTICIFPLVYQNKMQIISLLYFDLCHLICQLCFFIQKIPNKHVPLLAKLYHQTWSLSYPITFVESSTVEVLMNKIAP